MASKEDKEAAINARIAAIRAKNEERERRHREVENDRLQAEKSKSAVSVKSPEEKMAEIEDEGARFRSPFESNSSNSSTKSKKPVHERFVNKVMTFSKLYIRTHSSKCMKTTYFIA